MRGLKRIRLSGTAVMVLAGGLAAVANGQSFNVDIDVGFGDPGVGNGAPSSAFGGAAGQNGFWNRMGTGDSPQAVLGLVGEPTSVQMSAFAHKAGSGGGIGFRFEGNTGDYALLLNDARWVGTILQGGQITYTFSNLDAGIYEVYTYAVNVSGATIATPVSVFGGVPETEIVTGPMPGNALEHLVTHSIHRVPVPQSGSIDIDFVQPPNMHAAMHINGFQVKMVPELATMYHFAFGLILIVGIRKHKPRPKVEEGER